MVPGMRVGMRVPPPFVSAGGPARWISAVAPAVPFVGVVGSEGEREVVVKTSRVLTVFDGKSAIVLTVFSPILTVFSPRSLKKSPVL
jgi:hypothetical protein